MKTHGFHGAKVPIFRNGHTTMFGPHTERDDSSSMGIFEIISYFRTKKMVILNLLLYSLLKKKKKKSKKPMNGACEDYQYAPLSIICLVQ